MLIKYRGFYIERDKRYVSVDPIEEWDLMYPPSEKQIALRKAIVELWDKTNSALIREGKYGTITLAKKIIDKTIKEMK